MSAIFDLSDQCRLLEYGFAALLLLYVPERVHSVSVNEEVLLFVIGRGELFLRRLLQAFVSLRSIRRRSLLACWLFVGGLVATALDQLNLLQLVDNDNFGLSTSLTVVIGG